MQTTVLVHSIHHVHHKTVISLIHLISPEFLESIHVIIIQYIVHVGHHSRFNYGDVITLEGVSVLEGT